MSDTYTNSGPTAIHVYMQGIQLSYLSAGVKMNFLVSDVLLFKVKPADFNAI